MARSPHAIAVRFLPQGLHDLPAVEMRARVQAAVDEASPGMDAVLLGYGLCNNGLAGIRAGVAPLVLPRAHDCITLFLGDRARYRDYFFAKPGTYFKTSGWIESAEENSDLMQLSIPNTMGLQRTLEEYVAEYGEDNGRYLYETLGQTARHYGRYAFIEMGVEPDDRFERRTREDAERRHWEFEKLQGSMRLIDALVRGEWDPRDFLVVPPGAAIGVTNDEDIVRIDV